MADILANMIAGTRAQFAEEAHHSLRSSHGHHFAVHKPKQERRSPPPRRPRELSEMMHLDGPAPDPEETRAAKQRKIDAHNARIGALNNSKAQEEEEAE